jgi:hypothetical protein
VILSLTALGISALAFVLAALGFYWQWLRVGQLAVVVDPEIRMELDRNGVPQLVVELALMNDGASSVAVLEISGAFEKESSGERTRLKWDSFQEIRVDGSPDYQRRWEFVGRAGPLVIGPRSSIVRNVLFASMDALTLTAGSYRLRLEVFGGPRYRRLAAFTDTISVSEEQHAEMQSAGDSEPMTLLRRLGAPEGT